MSFRSLVSLSELCLALALLLSPCRANARAGASVHDDLGFMLWGSGFRIQSGRDGGCIADAVGRARGGVRVR